MKEFFEYNGHEIHIFAFELNRFESVDISYKTHPDLPLIQVIHMTCCMPVLLSPVFIENKCYIDGGITCNYPLNKCIEAKENVDEILGFVNNYEWENSDTDTTTNTKLMDTITSDSSLIEFLLGLFFKIIRSMETDTKQQKIKNEISYKAEHMSVGNLQDSLYFIETRQKLFQSGVDAANDFLEKIKKDVENDSQKNVEEKDVEEKDVEENVEENVDEVERTMHKYFAEKKVNTNSKGSQEWFYVTPEEVKRFFDSLKQTPKISIEYFKQRVTEEKLTLENYHDKIINDLPTIYEINKGYFESYTSFEEIMGVTFDRRR
jgi:hypothetical protein